MIAETLIAALFLALAVALLDANHYRREAERIGRSLAATYQEVADLHCELAAAKKTIASYEYARMARAVKEDGPR